MDHDRVFGLDVARAVAVLLVLVCHTQYFITLWFGVPQYLPLAYGGFLGVEIFFVLSGYLVGRIVIRASAVPSFVNWRIFMARRWWRTLPLYYACLAVLAVAWPLVFYASKDRDWGLGVIARNAFFVQNFNWHVAEGNWFSVSWSLTVEEWFYGVFSVALLALARVVGGGRALAIVLAVFLVGPAAWRFSTEPFNGLPYSVLTGVDQIGFGVVVAWVSLRRPVWFGRWVLLLMPGVLLNAAFWVALDWLFGANRHMRFALAPDVLALGLALCLPACARWREARGVAAGLVRWVSGRSYALYLTHLSILEFAAHYKDRGDISASGALMVALAAMVAIPEVSWRCLESPALRRRPRVVA